MRTSKTVLGYGKRWGFISPGFFVRFLFALLALAPAVSIIAAPDVPAALPRPDETNSQEVIRAYLRVQEQLQETQLAVERGRKELQEEAARNSQTLAARLQTIDQSVNSQRARELESMQSSNRVMLIVAGAFAGTGLLAMVLMAYFQWRTVNRLAQISSNMALAQGAGGHFPFLPLGEGMNPQLSVAAPQASSQRLLNALETLEQRIKQLEHTTQPTLPANPSEINTPMNNLDNGAVFPNGANGGHPGDFPVAPITALLAKGQALLNSDNAERALECFDEVLRLEPDNTEGLIKKGTSLERLRRLPEAIECYDLAIAANPALTIAYLYKGGLFNRMERFSEALECYEKALQAQEKRGS